MTKPKTVGSDSRQWISCFRQRTSEEEKKGKDVEEEEIQEIHDEEGKEATTEGSRPHQGFVEEEGKRKMQNPFRVSPSKLTTTIFHIQQPFINTLDDSVVISGLEDKVRDGRVMDDAAMKAAIYAMRSKTAYYKRAFKEPSSDVGGRPHHTALASAFWLVTKPQQKKVVSSLQDYLCRKNRIENVDKSEDCNQSPEGTQEGLLISQKEVLVGGGESNESLDVKQEGDDGEGKDKTAEYDFNFLVYDKKLKEPNNKVSVLLVEATWSDLSLAKMCQVASYGCKYGIKNMEKGRFDPIYLELWGEDRWRYGILYLTGLVVVENGQVVATTSTMYSIGELEKKLQANKQSYKDIIGEHVHPDGTYVEGTLYMPYEKFGLPGTGATHIADVQLFYQSKIRIIAGDQALKWTAKDVEDLVNTRIASVNDHEELETEWMPMSENKRMRKR